MMTSFQSIFYFLQVSTHYSCIEIKFDTYFGVEYNTLVRIYYYIRTLSYPEYSDLYFEVILLHEFCPISSKVVKARKMYTVSLFTHLTLSQNFVPTLLHIFKECSPKEAFLKANSSETQRNATPRTQNFP